MLSFPFPYSFRTRFVKVYECFPLSKMESKWEDLKHGGKIILPRSASHCLRLQSFPSPLLFKVINNENNRSTHVGVFEFGAKEGTCYIPDWIYRFLDLKDVDCITVEQITLPVGTYAKFQPIGLEFLSIKNPNSLLIIELHRYACLTRGDLIHVCYNNHVYELRVVETRPAEAVAIVIDELQMEFGDALPLKSCEKNSHTPDSVYKTTQLYGLPHFGYSLGELHFDRNTSSSITDRVFPIIVSQTIIPGKGISVHQNEEVD